MSRNRKRSDRPPPDYRGAILGVGLLVAGLFGLLVLLTPLGGKVKAGLGEIFGQRSAPVQRNQEGDVLRKTPPDRPLSPLEADPDPQFPRGVLRPPSGTDIRSLSKGINLKVEFDSEEGDLASLERNDEDSYLAEYSLKVRMPRPATSLSEVALTSPHLIEVFPGLREMIPQGNLSAWYRQLYANKTARVKSDIGRLGEILSRHNFYDCETILNLRSESTGQRLFLMQAEMDVVSDGSDGDRLPQMPDGIVNSTNYQPFTSYRWRKTGATPNPMVAGWESRIGKANKELEGSSVGEDRATWLRSRIKMLETGIADMKFASFLIAEYDPFIVIPTNIVKDRRDPYAPNIGDFAIVLYGRTAYPAIVGDAGPTYKVGEASLRLAREINAKSTPYSRPVSDLTVTYLVFPRSADDPRRAPDYRHWHKRCEELVDKIGGLGEGVELHQWKNLLAAE